jgi:hypothetical protein
VNPFTNIASGLFGKSTPPTAPTPNNPVHPTGGVSSLFVGSHQNPTIPVAPITHGPVQGSPVRPVQIPLNPPAPVISGHPSGTMPVSGTPATPIFRAQKTIKGFNPPTAKGTSTPVNPPRGQGPSRVTSVKSVKSFFTGGSTLVNPAGQGPSFGGGSLRGGTQIRGTPARKSSPIYGGPAEPVTSVGAL